MDLELDVVPLIGGRLQKSTSLACRSSVIAGAWTGSLPTARAGCYEIGRKAGG